MAGSMVFATVGTTKFTGLMQTLDKEEVQAALAAKGFKRLLIQTGKSTIIPVKRAGIEVSTYQFKPDLKEDMLAAKLIISHAGAGSVMEALRNRKKLIVVVNDKLMHNHQAELADAMSEAGYAASALPSTLLSVIESFDAQKLNPLPPLDLQPFAKAVTDLMAVKDEKKKE
mmetsp:Transcript_51837/g.121728  ORF Transcript_51837/g.121728 Transcript_51837/m.121728 type:complete len:171 (+) Transcript_51837:181-693(+)